MSEPIPPQPPSATPPAPASDSGPQEPPPLPPVTRVPPPPPPPPALLPEVDAGDPWASRPVPGPPSGRGAWGAVGTVALGAFVTVSGILALLLRGVSHGFIDLLTEYGAANPELPGVATLAADAPQALFVPAAYGIAAIVLGLLVFSAGIGATLGSDRGRRLAVLGVSAAAVLALAAAMHEQKVHLPEFRAWMERYESVGRESRNTVAVPFPPASAPSLMQEFASRSLFFQILVIPFVLWGLSTRAARHRCGAP